MNEHVEGKPVKYTTYTHHKCRCDGCTAALREWMRQYRKKKGGMTTADHASRRASDAAAKWVRHNLPDVWDHLMDEAWREVARDQR